MNIEGFAYSHPKKGTAVKSPLRLSLSWFSILLLAAALPARSATLRNDAYEIALQADGSVAITARGAAAEARTFTPTFHILYRQGNPGFSHKITKEEDYVLPEWSWARADPPQRTHDLFKGGNLQTVVAKSATVEKDTIRWTYAPNGLFSLTAALDLPPGDADPKLSWTLVARRESWFSVGFAGAPAADPREIDWLWQPLIWQEKRFPRLPFLSVESMGGLPCTLVTQRGVTVAVAADPAESPFRLPTVRNCRFGVAVRNNQGQAQPQLFAPVLGRADSWLDEGESTSFSAHLIVRAGDWYDTFTHVARRLYGFRDLRDNSIGLCLNDTLHNMIDFAMDDRFSRWNEELKGYDYTTDVPDSIKNVSALHPLSIALLTDREDVFRRRGLPMLEYLLSRQRYLYGLREDVKGQGASHLLRGPACDVGDLAALYNFTGNRTTVLRQLVQDRYDKGRQFVPDLAGESASFPHLLALYRVTGDKAALERAKAAADAYIHRRIDTPQTDLSDAYPERGGQFWSEWGPRWHMLYDLYRETGEKRYLDAAAKGARLYSQYCWFFPVIPDGDVTVNPGNKVGIYEHPLGANPPQPMTIPQESIPAWRVSQIGLAPEATNTYTGNPCVFLTTHAPDMLRLAQETSDPFLHDVARWAAVGRYGNYPGYDINGEFSTVYEKADYPLRPFTELTYNQMYYNHVWVQIAMLADYLISDAATRSKGQIDFPSRFSPGYVYLQTRVYGDRPGRFYGDDNVRLYMPRGLLKVDSPQVNYVTAYGNGNLYVALMNQSARPVTAALQIDPALCRGSHPVRLWNQNQPAAPAAAQDGRLTATIAGGGIAAFAIAGVEVKPSFQRRLLDDPSPPLSDHSYATTDSPFGKVHGMLLSFGRTLTSGYVYLEATDAAVKSARLHYRTGGEWREVEDAVYPYEFSLPLKPEEPAMEYWIEATTTGGKPLRSQPTVLKR
jgi:hypothetical protein